MIKLILKLENAVLFAITLFAYYHFQFNLLLFIILLFAPDVSMIGYFRNPKLGATIYNLIHNFVLAAIVLFFGYALKSNLLAELGLILTAHVALDRTLGFGLKLPTNFKHTHLQKI